MKKLFEAVCGGDINTVAWLLTEGVDVNSLDVAGIGTTPLMEAAWSGNLTLIKLLISAGAWVNASDRYGTTALMVAAEQGHTDVVRILLEAGADINAQDGHGCTALMFATICSSPVTAEYLIETGANLTIKNSEGYDAFYYALRAGKERLAFTVIDLMRGYTALKICNLSSQKEEVE